MLRRGGHVALLARRIDVLRAAEKELRALPFVDASQRISIHSVDVTHHGPVERAVEDVLAAHGTIDAAVCSAGQAGPKVFAESTQHDFDDLYRANVIGTSNVLRAVFPHMDSRTGGRAVLISSQAGAVGIYGYAAYSSSKFALRGLFECLSQEMHNKNVLLSLCFPPDTDTPQLQLERETIPPLTRILTASSETVQPDVVARAIADGMVSWRPYIGIGFDGWFLNLATVGMGPAGSFGAGVVQVLFGGIARLIAIVYVNYFYWVIRNKEADVMGKKSN